MREGEEIEECLEDGEEAVDVCETRSKNATRMEGEAGGQDGV